MKRDEVRAIFPGATEEQVDTLLNTVGAELNPLKSNVADLTSRLDEATNGLTASQASEAALRTQVDELTTRVQAGMSAEELLAQREKAAADREREFTLKSNELDARAIFVRAGFSDEDVAALLPRVVGEDADATKAAAQALVDFDARRREEAEKAVRADLLRDNPRLDGGSGSAPATVGEFLKLPYAEQLALKQADPTILSRLAKD